MFNLNPHTELTLYATFLYFITNYLCHDKNTSSKLMKMFNIKTNSSMKMLCLALFAIGFYFISKGMVHRRQGFKKGGQILNLGMGA